MLKELWVVALPIGNVGDLSARAKEALLAVDGVLAEDTRKFKDFCKWSGLKLSCDVQAFHADTEREKDYGKFFEKLTGRWALVSDAGTPAINDPGSVIVKAARHREITVRALPGPSALTLALQLSGGFGNPIVFLGFTPKKVKKDFFEQYSSTKTIVFFESRHNVMATLETLANSHHKNSRLVCLREMTKEHEEYFEGTISEHLRYFEKKLESDQVGELTFVLEGTEEIQATSVTFDIKDLIEFRKAAPSTAAKILARLTGITRDEAYEALKEN